jgi:hypothetical protein
MSTTYPNVALTPDLQSLLAGLRWRIRFYIWAEGIALALVWVGLMFWFGLALDYLPVLMGASEMPLAPRAVLLAANGLVLAYILYRWIGRRVFVPLGDRSLALVLERRFGGFHDSLVTAVEMADVPDHATGFNRELLARTTDEARAGAGDVRYGNVFNKGSLTVKIIAAVVIWGSLATFLATNTRAFDQAVQRLYLLSDEPWPRSAKIEVVGIEVLRNNAPGEEGPRTTQLEFENRVLKVARGANVSLKVRALQPPEAEVVPQYCTIAYRTETSGAGVRGERGSVAMNNFRDTADHRNFWFDGKPFKGVLSTIEFDVIGKDHRVSGYKLEVVDSPAVIETVLDIVSPKYMVDEATSSHLPINNQPYLPSGTFIPVGAQVTVKFKTNKPLKRAEIHSSDSNETTTVDIAAGANDKQQFAVSIDNLKASTVLEIGLLDADNVATERPFRVFLTAIEDQPPLVEVVLKGIGSAVTPDVMIPFRGKIGDDYGIAKSWAEIQVNEGADETDRPITLGAGGAVEHLLDFRNERIEKTGLAIEPGNKLMLAVKAADKFDLAGEPHVAVGDRYQLDVVTPEDLLAQLEVREIGLRRRFEQIIDEVTQMRDSLLRLKASLTSDSPAGDEPRGDTDLDAKQLTPEQKEQRAAELRLLRVQRAQQQSQKSLGEVLGVAAGFLSIREELINNRVDTEDRKNRLKEQIADPLNKTCSEQFPKLDERLAALDGQLTAGGVKIAAETMSPAADQAVDQVNLVLAELEAVLSKMQDLETYNELLDIVRDLLKDQQKLIERTQQERKRQTLEELKKLE